MEPRNPRPRLSTSSSMTSALDRLPPELTRRLLAFVDDAVSAPTADALLLAPPRVPTELLRCLRQVSSAWKATARELEASVRATHETLTFSIDESPAAQALVLCQTLQHRRTPLRSLQLVLNLASIRERFDIARACGSADRFDDAIIPWDAVFQRCRGLERLDLSGLPLRSVHVAHAIDAASRHCPALYALVLPKREWFRGPLRADDVQTLLVPTLISALQRWAEHGPRRGLVQLVIPALLHLAHSDDEDSTTLADDVVTSIIRYCPHLQSLSEWTKNSSDPRVCGSNSVATRRDPVSQGTWQSFCQSCQALEAIDWCQLQPSDAMLETFTSSLYPSLKRMRLPCLVSSTTSGGTFSQRICQLVRACPALQELVLCCDEDAHDCVSLSEALDDALLETLAACCPQLRRLVMHHDRTEDVWASGSSSGLTNHGLEAIARIDTLQELTIHGGRSADAALVALMTQAPTDQPVRQVNILLNSIDSFSRPIGTTLPSFESIVASILETLTRICSQLRGKRFHVHILNGSRGARAATPSEVAALTTAIKELQSQSPNIFVRCRRRGRHTISDVTISTSRVLFFESEDHDQPSTQATHAMLSSSSSHESPCFPLVLSCIAICVASTLLTDIVV
ncbi:hypothetical protein PINS_up008315 [Pythium insidiosum]|nr:hypothetical protein PINS_up008315 [Pythium insidiosum]